MTSQGHLPAQYARACSQGNYLIAAGLTAQMRPLALSEALLLLPLIADNEPAKFDAAAVRWHARWQLGGSGIDLASSGLALAALGRSGGQGGRTGYGCCADLCNRWGGDGSVLTGQRLPSTHKTTDGKTAKPPFRAALLCLPLSLDRRAFELGRCWRPLVDDLSCSQARPGRVVLRGAELDDAVVASRGD